MAILGRKRLPPELEPAAASFDTVFALVERSGAVLTQAAPTTRYDGRPFADVLLDFELGLREAAEEMPGWRRVETDEVWRTCGEGLGLALRLSERLRHEAPDIRGFEAMIATIDALIAPLEAFERAAERFRDLRRRGSSG
ncbi:MAG: hypothetical protein WEA10_11400 [Actinomycetota bacterium]